MSFFKKLALTLFINLWLWFGIFWIICILRNAIDRP